MSYTVKKETIVKRITEAFDKCEGKWSSRFVRFGVENLFTGRPYNGVNVLSLCFSGFGDSRFATPKQIRDNGHKIKAEEYDKFNFIYFCKPVVKRDIAANGIEMSDADEYQRQTGRNPVIWIYNSYIVYNNEQLETPITNAVNKNKCESAVNAVSELAKINNITMKTGTGSAFYSTTEDFISVPSPSEFYSDEGYALTSFHEMSHWTGHKDRLARDLDKYHDINNRGNEEAIAELSAHMIASAKGIEVPERRFIESADYIKTWLDRTKDKTNEFFSVVSKADKASQYILNAGKLRTYATEE